MYLHRHTIHSQPVPQKNIPAPWHYSCLDTHAHHSMVVNEVFKQHHVVVHQYWAALIEKKLAIDTTRLACHPLYWCLGVLDDRCEGSKNVPILCQ